MSSSAIKRFFLGYCSIFSTLDDDEGELEAIIRCAMGFCCFAAPIAMGIAHVASFNDTYFDIDRAHVAAVGFSAAFLFFGGLVGLYGLPKKESAMYLWRKSWKSAHEYLLAFCMTVYFTGGIVLPGYFSVAGLLTLLVVAAAIFFAVLKKATALEVRRGGSKAQDPKNDR